MVLLEVALKNSQPAPVLFAPGQLRLKLVPSGTTVTPQDFNRGPGAIAAGATEHLWISYLAPHDSLEMELEYSEPELDGTMSLALPPLTATRVLVMSPLDLHINDGFLPMVDGSRAYQRAFAGHVTFPTRTPASRQ